MGGGGVKFGIACDHALSLYLFNLFSRGGHDTILSQIKCKKARIWTFFWLDRKQWGWFALFRLAKMPPFIKCWFQSAFLDFKRDFRAKIWYPSGKCWLANNMTGRADVKLFNLGSGWRFVKWMYQALFFFPLEPKKQKIIVIIITPDLRLKGQVHGSTHARYPKCYFSPGTYCMVYESNLIMS